MKDILDREIEEGQIIAYAAREKSIQVNKLAIVYEPEHPHGLQGMRILVKPTQKASKTAGGYAIYNNRQNLSETVSIRANQVIVLDKSTLPKEVVKSLENSYGLYLKKKREGTRLVDKEWYKKSKEKAWLRRLKENNSPEMLDAIQEDVAHINRF